MLKEQILSLFGRRLRELAEWEKTDFEHLQEIRLRIGQPVLLVEHGREKILPICVCLENLKGILNRACGYSGYAFEEEISRGYLTVAGGHRIGVAGRAVVTESGIQTLKHISSLNIRIAHQIKGCALRWKDFFYKEGNLCHILIISPPGCGKTTLLRDMIRCLSEGDERHPGVTVGVVDERSEIAGTYRGTMTYDLGMRTDVLDGCPKDPGIEMLLRSMSPEVLAVDEIGIHDVKSIENALRCGCKLLATLHGEGIEDYIDKPGFGSLVENRVFERYILLSRKSFPGIVSSIYGQDFEVLWEEGRCT